MYPYLSKLSLVGEKSNIFKTLIKWHNLKLVYQQVK